jgi:hypothetical protein
LIFNSHYSCKLSVSSSGTPVFGIINPAHP